MLFMIVEMHPRQYSLKPAVQFHIMEPISRNGFMHDKAHVTRHHAPCDKMGGKWITQH